MDHYRRSQLNCFTDERHDAACRVAFDNFAAESVEFACEHRDIVASFGRFSHRNKALGCSSTDEELDYLAAGAPDFGQTSAGGAKEQD